MEGKLLVILFGIFLWVAPIEDTNKEDLSVKYLNDVKRLNSILEKENTIIEKKVNDKVKKGQEAMNNICVSYHDTIFIERETIIYDTIYSFIKSKKI